MGKKCTMCEEDAEFCIKGSIECYCEECAKEHFSDLDLLQRVEQQAVSLKETIENKDS